MPKLAGQSRNIIQLYHLKASSLKVWQLIMQLAGFLRIDRALSASSFNSPITKFTIRSTHPSRKASKLPRSAASPILEHLCWHSSPCRQSRMMAAAISEPSSQRVSRMRWWAEGAGAARARGRRRTKATMMSLKRPIVFFVFVKLYYNMLYCALQLSAAKNPFPTLLNRS